MKNDHHCYSKKLQAFINTCLYHVIDILWPENISNKDLNRRIGQLLVDVLIKWRMWQWIGHTLRKDNECFVNYAMEPIFQTGPKWVALESYDTEQ